MAPASTRRRSFVQGTALLLLSSGAPRWLVGCSQPTSGQPERGAEPASGTAGKEEDNPDGRGPDRLVPFLTPLEDFYVYANNEPPPPLSLEDANLRTNAAGGATGAEESRVVGWAELAALPQQQIVRTLCCVGNGKPFDRVFGWRFGGISNGTWDVLPLSQALEHLGCRPGSPSDHLRVVGRDDWIRNFTQERVAEGALFLAFGLNGVPLPHAHGGPARLLCTGDYGEMNVKWVRSISWGPPRAEEDGEGFTTDLPGAPFAFATMPLWGARVGAGALQLAGVAYAGRSAVRQVLVTLDGGDAQAADLLDQPQPGVWCRWQAQLELPPGSHEIAITCVDLDGRRSRIMTREVGFPSHGDRPIHELPLLAT